MTITATTLLDLDQAGLDDLFTSSEAGPIPAGEAEGTVILAKDTTEIEIAAKLAHLIAWKGKVFDPEKGELRPDEGAEPEPGLAEAEAAASAAWESLAAGLAGANDEDPLARLCRAFDLEPVPIQALLLSLAPELHVKYQRIFAFHNDDAARRAATLGLIGLVLGDTVGVRTALARAPRLFDLRVVTTADGLPAGAEPYFWARRLRIDGRQRLDLPSRFLVGVVLAGSGAVATPEATLALEAGDTFALPAAAVADAELAGDSTLEVILCGSAGPPGSRSRSPRCGAAGRRRGPSTPPPWPARPGSGPGSRT